MIVLLLSSCDQFLVKQKEAKGVLYFSPSYSYSCCFFSFFSSSSVVVDDDDENSTVCTFLFCLLRNLTLNFVSTNQQRVRSCPPLRLPAPFLLLFPLTRGKSCTLPFMHSMLFTPAPASRVCSPRHISAGFVTAFTARFPLSCFPSRCSILITSPFPRILSITFVLFVCLVQNKTFGRARKT